MVKRVLPVVVMAALVALAGSVLLRPAPQTTAAGTITAVRADEVCLSTAGHDVCLDREHINHLALAAARPGECVDATWAGDLVVAEALVRVAQRGCQPA